MIETREALLAHLAERGIATTTIDHPPLHSVAESREHCGAIAGAHTKNLLLIDKKKAVYLVVAEETTTVDLKALHRRIGASGRLSFASADRMRELLGVEPGSVTAFGVVNDTGHSLRVVVDAALTAHDMVNAHPLTNTATTTIATTDLLTFLRDTGHEPMIERLGPESETSGDGQVE